MLAHNFSASSAFSASARTRTTGSVPDGRTSTRPLEPSSALSLSDSSRIACVSSRRATATLRSDLWEARHHRGGIRQRAAVERATEQKPGREPVAGRVVSEPDDVARLLAAEQASFPAERLGDVPVADRCRDDANAVLLHERVEAEVRHDGHRDDVDAERECEHGQDLVAVDDLALPSTASIRSPSPSKAMPRSRFSPVTRCCRARRSVAPQPTLMFEPSGSMPIACTSAPSSENERGASPENAPFAQSRPIRRPLRSLPHDSRTCAR